MDAAYFDELIKINQDGITSFQRWWRVLIVCGVIIFLTGVVVWIMSVMNKIEIESQLVPALPTSFGILTGSAALFPLKEITPRRLAIAKYNHLKKECERIKKLPVDKRQKKLKELADYLKEL
jgi:hypothetical protein